MIAVINWNNIIKMQQIYNTNNKNIDDIINTVEIRISDCYVPVMTV